jgi:hypothetical protein
MSRTASPILNREPPASEYRSEATPRADLFRSYLTGAEKLGKQIENCIVFEDAPSGIKSGVASGARVLAVCTSHTREQVSGMGATWIVDDLTKYVAFPRYRGYSIADFCVLAGYLVLSLEVSCSWRSTSRHRF